ncbi:hypothetical protein OESDEN_24128, partial [Oesophagostomum dentatum]
MAAAGDDSQLAKLLEAMIEQTRLQHQEMKSLFTAFTSSQNTAVCEQGSKFTPDDETDVTFDYWFKRYGPLIRSSALSHGKKRDLILMKLDEDAYRKYANAVLPLQPHE